MSHWAELDENNKVIRVLVGDNNDPNGDEGYQWLLDNLGGTWVQTSYTALFVTTLPLSILPTIQMQMLLSHLSLNVVIRSYS